MRIVNLDLNQKSAIPADWEPATEMRAGELWAGCRSNWISFSFALACGSIDHCDEERKLARSANDSTTADEKTPKSESLRLH